jgi:hypothetical protein
VTRIDESQPIDKPAIAYGSFQIIK